MADYQREEATEIEDEEAQVQETSEEDEESEEEIRQGMSILQVINFCGME